VNAGIDGHAHVFAPDLPFVEPRRYTPAYAATIGQLVAHLDARGLAGGLLTQPSFLGTDNSHMLAAVARYPARLRAVVMVDPAIDDAGLDALGGQGAVGIRLNLEGLPLPDLRAGPWPALLERLRQRDWHVEFHRKGRDLPGLIAPVLEAGVRVCVDHFGRPDPESPLDDPGLRYLLDVGRTGRVWVKISAAYRNGGVERGEEVARLVAPRLVDAFGPRRLLWGSDWPHTQHEALVDHAGAYAALARWVPDAATRQEILAQGAAELLQLTPTVG
jgi:predicted TIM-barrel fold metal-dependent hydrolase